MAGQPRPCLSPCQGSWCRLGPRIQPGIFFQLSDWPAVAEAAAVQGCQTHTALAGAVMWPQGGRGMTLRPTGQVDGPTSPPELSRQNRWGSEWGWLPPSCTTAGDTMAWHPEVTLGYTGQGSTLLLPSGYGCWSAACLRGGQDPRPLAPTSTSAPQPGQKPPGLSRLCFPLGASTTPTGRVAFLGCPWG